MLKKISNLFYKKKSNDTLIKKIFLFGIIYLKKNRETHSSEFRFLGIPILSKKVSFGKAKYYFLFIKVFQKSSRKYLYNILLEHLKKQYDNIYINYNCSGETYLYLAYIKPNPNSIFIATKKYHIDLCRMMHPNIDCIYIPNLLIFRSFDNIYIEKYKGKFFYNVLPFKHFVKLEKNIKDGKKVHYCNALLKTIGKEDINEAKLPSISESIKKSAINKMNRIGLNLDNFVFICPESQSNEKLEENYWINLTNKLFTQGYDIFINEMTLNPDYGIGKTCYLTLDEAYYIASLSKQIIGLRSGFIEILATIKDVPITCLYTDFKQRGQLEPIEAEKVLNGFTLKKLPNTNYEKIIEIDINNIDKDEILKSFISNN